MMSFHVSDTMVPYPFLIKKIQRETYDTFTLELKPMNGTDAFSFATGQFNMLYTFGVGEVPISISSDPAKPETLAHTVREAGIVTQAICRLKPGDMLGVRGPFGSHWPIEKAQGSDIVIVAGGIGLAPLRSLLYHLLAQRDNYRKIILLYGTRTPNDLLYERQLMEWRGRFDLDINVTVDSALGDWRGNVGVVTTLIRRAKFDPFSTVAMVCGPEVMMRFTIMELQRCGVERKNIFLSMERNMKCAVGFCGHCQFGPAFICKDGPVFRYDKIRPFFRIREL